MFRRLAPIAVGPPRRRFDPHQLLASGLSAKEGDVALCNAERFRQEGTQHGVGLAIDGWRRQRNLQARLTSVAIDTDDDGGFCAWLRLDLQRERTVGGVAPPARCRH
jgi:hypothetical protein